MYQFLEWLRRSSADPAKTAITIKGIVLGLAPILMLLFNIPSDDFNLIANNIEQLVFYASAGLSVSMVLFGLLRKIALGRWAASTWDYDE